jgi:predicted ester cyclase
MAEHDSAKNKQLIREHYDATTNNYDPVAIDRQVADDFVDHGTPGVKGPEGVKRHITALLAGFPDMKVTIDAIIAESDLVAVRGTWRGTHRGEFRGTKPAGAKVEFSGMVFWRVRDGKICERWGLVDAPALMQQLKPG